MTSPETVPTIELDGPLTIELLILALADAEVMEQSYKRITITFSGQHGANHFFDLIQPIVFPEPKEASSEAAPD